MRGDLSPELHSTYTMLESAFPNGIVEESEEYYAVLRALCDYMSYKQLARVIAAFTVRTWGEAHNDVGRCLSTNQPSSEALESVVEKLSAHGYQQWKEEE